MKTYVDEDLVVSYAPDEIEMPERYHVFPAIPDGIFIPKPIGYSLDYTERAWEEGATEEEIAAHLNGLRLAGIEQVRQKIDNYRAKHVARQAIQQSVYADKRAEALLCAADENNADDITKTPVLRSQVILDKWHYTNGVIPPGQEGGKTIKQAVLDEAALILAIIVPLKSLAGTTEAIRANAQAACEAATTQAEIDEILTFLDSDLAQLP